MPCPCHRPSYHQVISCLDENCWPSFCETTCFKFSKQISGKIWCACVTPADYLTFYKTSALHNILWPFFFQNGYINVLLYKMCDQPEIIQRRCLGSRILHERSFQRLVSYISYEMIISVRFCWSFNCSKDSAIALKV